MNQILEKGTTFIWENARLLERAVFDYRFRGGPPGRIIEILQAYQNEDGGFGHALEPDLRAADSQPLFAEFALRTMYDCGLHDPEITGRVCDFLSRHAGPQKGIPTIFPSSQQYPRADHWNNPGAQEPSLDRLTSLVGLVSWQGASHTWLQGAVEVCLEHIQRDEIKDAHIIQNAFCLVESLTCNRPMEMYFDKLVDDLSEADFFIADGPVRSYGLTPLDFAPAPDSYCRRIFTDTQIEAHLDDLQAHQEQDGGWSIAWQPPAGQQDRNGGGTGR
ncbi:MAG: hypothetical protein A2136_00110 [Chloroflexi bacterium RBG_16_54_11]|nr:MAG: hypothetical protein A2136_00110 [Chloroflexi bacterium RBG_16_54_11]